MPSRNAQFSQIQFHGQAGSTRPCLHAIVRLIHFGDKITKAALLTHDNEHCFLLSINEGDRVAIKSGFSSGYLGEGPSGLATALQILERHGAEIDEYFVPKLIIDAIDESALRRRQLEEIDALRPRRPNRWFDYIYSVQGTSSLENNHQRLNEQFPPALPYAIIDPRIVDLALSFSENPDGSLITAYRRLEDLVREKTGLASESSTRLFSKAFQGDMPLLHWDGIESSEQKARAGLFDVVYRAYRNPRAHREAPGHLTQAVREFLLLNELFLLESEAVRQEPPQPPLK